MTASPPIQPEQLAQAAVGVKAANVKPNEQKNGTKSVHSLLLRVWLGAVGSVIAILLGVIVGYLGTLVQDTRSHIGDGERHENDLQKQHRVEVLITRALQRNQQERDKRLQKIEASQHDIATSLARIEERLKK